jgi:hypothetical protein
MDAWEYRSIGFGGVIKGVKLEEMDAALTELGKEGWEAVGITAEENKGKLVVLLKRRLPGAGVRSSNDAWGRW